MIELAGHKLQLNNIHSPDSFDTLQFTVTFHQFPLTADFHIETMYQGHRIIERVPRGTPSPASRSERRSDSRSEYRTEYRSDSRSEYRPELRSKYRSGFRSEPRSEPYSHAVDRYDEPLEIYLQIGVPDQYGESHWMITMKQPNRQRAMRLHSVGEEGDYELSMEKDQEFIPSWVRTTHYLGEIPKEGSAIVPMEAEKIPPQVSDMWACYLIRKMENLGLIERGQCRRFMTDYRHNLDGDEGPRFR
ncbi:uncharacterized protein N7506_001449 [Penicillium brevicompactum]|uniref:uncharacterized protein n=1 Tax=Penicillium brevicompactum TaxID=5074 RepID=UPI0025406451|nr:uncharacterized protein N7506_001449 [Penicillium brevicompactum]KAJ5348196.1 hypothetical protein N7506_001449 [Penicillium brevicompactum]